MSNVTSRDGTFIAFERIGSGPALILVDGALCHRGMGPCGPLATLLAKHFSVFTYDRRGRGESGDTKPYAIEREVDDIAALVAEAGGEAYLWGTSSGAALALEAAKRVGGIKKLATYEAPFIVDNSRSTTERSWIDIDNAVTDNRQSDAVRHFLNAVGAPGFFIAIMRLTPTWAKLTASAPTLPYDGAIVRQYQLGLPLPKDAWTLVTVPTLVMDGGKSPAWIRNGNRALADLLPNAQYRTLAGQTHMLTAKVHAPILTDFFGTP